MQPTQSIERFEILDVLRGFALLGVMIANMAYHSGYWFLSPDKQASLSFHVLGEAFEWTIHFITEGKFYSIFFCLEGEYKDTSAHLHFGLNEITLQCWLRAW